MRRSRSGYTLLEAMAAIAILGLAILASSGFLVRRTALMRSLDAQLVASEAMTSELTSIEADAPASLALGERRFSLDLSRVPLRDARGRVTVERAEAGLRRVRLELTWNRGRLTRERLVEVSP